MEICSHVLTESVVSSYTNPCSLIYSFFWFLVNKLIKSSLHRLIILDTFYLDMECWIYCKYIFFCLSILTFL